MSSTEIETHTRILEATRRLLEQKRGQGVRLSDIGRAAGISRQAVYLHFRSRTELLIATVRYVDEINEIEKRLERLQNTSNGKDALTELVDFWGNYIPQIYGLAKALLTARDTDEAAAAAWEDRMSELREGCRHVIKCLEREHALRMEWNVKEAAELFWAMLSISIWENLTIERGWSKDQYIQAIQSIAKRAFVKE